MAVENAGRVVLVSGATGTQGGAVARALLDRGFGVRALTRDPESRGARALVEAGAEVVRGDFGDRTSLEQAVSGVYGVYSVQNFHEEGTDAERRHGEAIAEIAARQGVSHFVYSSVGGADCETGISFHDSKLAVEQRIRELGIPSTIFRPAFFMRNWREVRDSILSGVLPWPLDPDKTLQQLAVEDIGRYVATAFENPQIWIGTTTEIAGDELTMTEVADTFARVLGRPVRYEQVPWATFAEIMRGVTGVEIGPDLTRMFSWFNESGFVADIPRLRAEYPDLTSLEEFLRRDGWDVLGASALASGTGRSEG